MGKRMESYVDHRDTGPLATILNDFPPRKTKALMDLSLSQFEQGTYVVRVRSHLLGEDIYFVSDEKLFDRVPEGFVVYTGKELKALAARKRKGMTRDELKRVHRLKRTVDGEVVD